MSRREREIQELQDTRRMLKGALNKLGRVIASKGLVKTATRYERLRARLREDLSALREIIRDEDDQLLEERVRRWEAKHGQPAPPARAPGRSARERPAPAPTARTGT